MKTHLSYLRSLIERMEEAGISDLADYTILAREDQPAVVTVADHSFKVFQETPDQSRLSLISEVCD